MQIMLWILLSVGMAQTGAERIMTQVLEQSLSVFAEDDFAVADKDAEDDEDEDDEEDDDDEGPVEDAYTYLVGGSEDLEFVRIPAGSFFMGARDGDDKADDDERPLHEVRISRSFYLGKYPVTQAVWESVMGENPSRFLGRSRPVENVSWDDVQIFLERLNQGGEYGQCRLPTEAEWEYAARAGSQGVYLESDAEEDLAGYAWYDDNSETRTRPVGGISPNAWGLYDMYGNVWEWVQDYYHAEYYDASPAVDPQGPALMGGAHVVRGCSWNSAASACRSTYRAMDDPQARDSVTGFRLVCSSPR